MKNPPRKSRVIVAPLFMSITLNGAISETETHKKHMWTDVGLGDRLREIDDVDGDLLAGRLPAIRVTPAAALDDRSTP